MARDKHRAPSFATAPAPQAPLPSLESAAPAEALSPPEPASLEVVEESLPVAIEEVAAPLAPTAPGLVIACVKHGTLRRSGQRYAEGDLVEMPQAEAERLACEGIVSFV
jgi:hypothetical protein